MRYNEPQNKQTFQKPANQAGYSWHGTKLNTLLVSKYIQSHDICSKSLLIKQGIPGMEYIPKFGEVEGVEGGRSTSLTVSTSWKHPILQEESTQIQTD